MHKLQERSATMKILLFNCSIKKKASRSLKIANSFIEGLNQNINIREEIQVNEITLYDKNINDCRCCYYCWCEEASGKCIQKDDMQDLLKEYIDSDLVIWSFPLLFFSFPAAMKKFIERTFPLYTWQKHREGDYYIQSSRYPKLLNRREVFISTCGYPHRTNNYEPVDETLRILFGDKADRIFCTQGTLFDEERFEKIVKRYLEAAKNAGKNYSLKDGITKKDNDRLSQQFLIEELYYEESKRNNKWLIRKDYLNF